MRNRCFLVASGILVAAFLLVGCSTQSMRRTPVGSTPKIDSTRTYELAINGSDISKEEAVSLEKKITSNQNDLEARIQLLAYYFGRHNARSALQGHALWVIENCPDSVIAGLPYALLNPVLDGKSYEKARELWIKHVNANPKNAQIIWNAAEFSIVFDKSMAENLLKKGQALEPNDSRWTKQLGFLNELHAKDQSGTVNTSLKNYEDSYNATKDEQKRFYKLADLAKSAFTAGDLKKARSYADLLLTEAKKYQDDWNYGNAIHHGNLILGRLALQSGNLAEAKARLIAAGKTPGSPQLNSFGPNMMLAKELLDKGQKDVVLEYFQLCGKFWDMGKDDLKDWTETVKKGGIPDFGANLDF